MAAVDAAALPLLNAGASPPIVKDWQVFLIGQGLGGTGPKLTGTHDAESQDYTKKFQAAKSLPQTGEVDVATWKAGLTAGLKLRPGNIPAASAASGAGGTGGGGTVDVNVVGERRKRADAADAAGGKSAAGAVVAWHAKPVWANGPSWRTALIAAGAVLAVGGVAVVASRRGAVPAVPTTSW